MILIRQVLWTTTYLLLTKRFQLSSSSPPALQRFINTIAAPNNNNNTCSMGSHKKLDVYIYESGTSSVAFVTTPDMATAKKLALGLVEGKHAACVNIIPGVTSIYMWDNKINEDNEHLMMIKTQTYHLDELTKYVRDHHPYSVAEVITIPIDKGNGLYLRWLAESIEDKPEDSNITAVK